MQYNFHNMCIILFFQVWTNNNDNINRIFEAEKIMLYCIFDLIKKIKDKKEWKLLITSFRYMTYYLFMFNFKSIMVLENWFAFVVFTSADCGKKKLQNLKLKTKQMFLKDLCKNEELGIKDVLVKRKREVRN